MSFLLFYNSSTNGNSLKSHLNVLSWFPKEVAFELGLPDPEKFTGHCWRRSAGTNGSEAGLQATQLMSAFGWASARTAMGYIDKTKSSALSVSLALANIVRADLSIEALSPYEQLVFQNNNLFSIILFYI